MHSVALHDKMAGPRGSKLDPNSPTFFDDMKKDIAAEITKSLDKSLLKKIIKFEALFKGPKGVTPRLNKVEKSTAAMAKMVKKLKADMAENQVEIAEINKVLDDDKEGKTLGLVSHVENLQKDSKVVNQRLTDLEKARPKVFLPENVQTYSKEEVDDIVQNLKQEFCSKSQFDTLQRDTTR